MKTAKLIKKLDSQVEAKDSVQQSPVPLFMTIEQYLDRGIREGKFNPDRRLPSEMELARKFGASRLTVVRAMLELKNRGLIERRAGSGTYIRKNPPVSGPRALKLGLIASGLGHTEILDPICTEIARHAQAHGHQLIHGSFAGGLSQDFSSQQAILLAEQYIANKVDGVIFAPLELPDQRSAINETIATMLKKAGIAVVLLDRDITDFPARSAYDLVSMDNFAAGFSIGSHLVERKCRRICFLARPRFPGTTDLRVAGVRDAVQRADRTAFWFVSGEPDDLSFVQKIMTAHKPDAIVCSNDRTAAMLMQTLVELKLHVPQDLMLAAFDDVQYATLLSPPLTTMRQPCRDIAATALQMIVERIAQPALPARMCLLGADLIVRKSTDNGREALQQTNVRRY